MPAEPGMKAGDMRPPQSGGERPPGDRHGGHQDERNRDPRHPSERRRRTWSPWLVVRYRHDDLGFRVIPAGQVFWASPDIDVKSSVSGQAVAGEPNIVTARVVNLGKADGRPTRADFYWADPSLGLGPAQMNYIGTRWRQADYHRATSFSCPTPWVPVMVNGGHECLFVNVTSDILNDRLTHPFQPQLDRRAAQRNIAVLAAAPAQSIPFWVMVNNVAPMMANVTVACRVAHLTAVPDARAHMPRHELASAASVFRDGASDERGVFRQAAGAGPAEHRRLVRSEMSERRAIIDSPEGRRFFAALLDHAPVSREWRQEDGLSVLHELSLDAFEQRRLDLELTVPPSARPGDFVLFHLTEHVADILVGGYTIAAHV